MNTHAYRIAGNIATKCQGIRLLDATEVQQITEKVANCFIKDKNHLWWWESLSQSPTIIKYDNSEFLEVIGGFLGHKSGALCLILTDDEFPPWCGIAGESEDMLAAIQELPAIEFFIVPQDIGWIVFETHHNELIIAGVTR
jgi:hypothetical protein